MTTTSSSPQISHPEETRFRTIFEQSPMSTQVFNAAGDMIAANRAWEELWGVAASDLPGYNILRDQQLVDTGVMPYIERGFAGERVDVPVIKYVPDNTRPRVSSVPYRWVRSTIYPVMDQAGGIREVVLMHEDITEQYDAEARLHESESQYRSIFEASQDGLIITDMTGNLVEVNPALCRMHGFSRDEFLRLHPREFIHPDSHPVFVVALERIADGKDFFSHLVAFRKDGSTLDVEVYANSFVYRGEPHILGVVRDITERVQAYELLEERVDARTRELQTMLDVSRTITSTLDPLLLVDLILDQLRRVIEFPDASILRAEGEIIRIIGSRGEVPLERVLNLSFPLVPGSPLWPVIHDRQTIVIDDIYDDSEQSRPIREATERFVDHLHIRSWVAVPMIVGDRVLGALNVSHGQTGFFTRARVEFIHALAQQAAIALENARLYQRAQELAAIEERQRLARELHDSVTQALFSMTLHAQAVKMMLDRQGIPLDGPLGASMQQLGSLAQVSVAEMRALLFELRPEALSEEGLVAGLRKRAAALSAREEVSVEIEAPEERLPLIPLVEEQLYRIAQEALHNILKHAHARRVTVRVCPSGSGALHVEIEDDGVGFDPSVPRPGHLGLGSMGERARSINGTLSISSTPGQGTAVRVDVPQALD